MASRTWPDAPPRLVAIAWPDAVDHYSLVRRALVSEQMIRAPHEQVFLVANHDKGLRIKYFDTIHDCLFDLTRDR